MSGLARVSAMHEHSNTQSSHQCLADLRENRISNEKGIGLMAAGEEEWITVTLTHRTMRSSRSCHLTSAFDNIVVFHRLYFLLQPSWPQYGSTALNKNMNFISKTNQVLVRLRLKISH
ncbi:hypothetical protein EVAR_44924_1 [Eumeta japonica]|uniref:Uncharacterized protein n=1 Tax=Eumeta variegata TaxID=151549 RepID=A0A4C1XLE1_EUMVA|nr:hypothetical protein EVAR_44924_1 [Eumeta japonica]